MYSFISLDKNAGIIDWLIKYIALISGKPDVWSECSWVNKTASIFVHLALYSCALKSGLVSISVLLFFVETQLGFSGQSEKRGGYRYRRVYSMRTGPGTVVEWCGTTARCFCCSAQAQTHHHHQIITRQCNGNGNVGKGKGKERSRYFMY